MTIKDQLTITTAKLQKSGLKEPFLEAKWLLAAVLKKPTAFILAHPELKLKSHQIATYKRLSEKRAQGWPFAYLVGQQEFYGLDFFVNKNVLIPRPETELMVAEIITEAQKISGPKDIIDVGTGSGCILITLAKILTEKNKNATSNFNAGATTTFFGLDVSAAALRVARRNAKKYLNQNYQIMKSDLLQTWLKKYQPHLKNQTLLIAANLPYLTTTQVKAEPSIKKEPRQALVAGHDGLKYYRELFSQIKKISNPLILFCEIDPRQSLAFQNLVETALPNFSNQIKSDLAGLDRLVIIRSK